MSTPIPTLIDRPQPQTILNPDVVDVELDCARVRWPDGRGQIIDVHHKRDPQALADLLRKWLTAHLVAVGALEEDE